jgi:hypothetical protein
LAAVGFVGIYRYASTNNVAIDKVDEIVAFVQEHLSTEHSLPTHWLANEVIRYVQQTEQQQTEQQQTEQQQQQQQPVNAFNSSIVDLHHCNRQLVQSWRRDLAPTCAILGGIVAQEIIKIVSGKGQPLSNVFTFDGLHGPGLIDSIAPPNNH